jgi:signal transduction histidine kinase
LIADYKAEINDNLPLDIEDGIYRIALEALNNTLKLAKAQHVCLKISHIRSMIELNIADDGAGFELESVQKQGGMGLNNMQARAKPLGGILTIQSQPSEGTQIILDVPVRVS